MLVTKEKSLLQPCPECPTNLFSSEKQRGSCASLSSVFFFLNRSLYKETPVQKNLQKKHLSRVQWFHLVSLSFCHSVSTPLPLHCFYLWVFPLCIYSSHSWRTLRELSCYPLLYSLVLHTDSAIPHHTGIYFLVAIPLIPKHVLL